MRDLGHRGLQVQRRNGMNSILTCSVRDEQLCSGQAKPDERGTTGNPCCLCRAWTPYWNSNALVASQRISNRLILALLLFMIFQYLSVILEIVV